MPDLTDDAHTNPTNRALPRGTVREGARRYDGHAGAVQEFSACAMRDDELQRRARVQTTDCEGRRRLDFSRPTLPVGRNLGDCIGQRHPVREGARLSSQAIPYQSHSHIGLQLASEQNCRKAPFPRTGCIVQVLRG